MIIGDPDNDFTRLVRHRTLEMTKFMSVLKHLSNVVTGSGSDIQILGRERIRVGSL